MPFTPFSCFRIKFVTMVETFEWPFLLNVGEVMVPFEFGDQCDPLGTKRQKGKHAKRSHDFGADAARGWSMSYDLRVLSKRFGGGTNFRPINSRSSFRRHDARKIVGIGEKEKDVFDSAAAPIARIECDASSNFQSTVNGKESGTRNDEMDGAIEIAID